MRSIYRLEATTQVISGLLYQTSKNDKTQEVFNDIDI